MTGIEKRFGEKLILGQKREAFAIFDTVRILEDLLVMVAEIDKG